MKRRLVSIRRRLIPSPQIPKSTDFFQDGYRPRLPADPLLQRARAPFSGLFLPSPQYFDTSTGKVSTSWHGAGRDVWHRRVRAECHGQLVFALPRGGLCLFSPSSLSPFMLFFLPSFFSSLRCFPSFGLLFILFLSSFFSSCLLPSPSYVLLSIISFLPSSLPISFSLSLSPPSLAPDHDPPMLYNALRS